MYKDKIKDPAFYRNNWGITSLDTVFAGISIRFLKGGWPYRLKPGRNQSLDDYHPRNAVDSIALKNFITKKNLFSAHLELAEYYQKSNQYDKAFKEYQALYYLLPYETDLYLNAGKMLLKMNRYIDALKILNRSLEYRETAFALQWIGQILLIHRKFKEGIIYLEKARARGSADIQLFYNLALAYFMLGKSGKAYEIMKYIEKQWPASPYLDRLKKIRAIAHEQSQ